MSSDTPNTRPNSCKTNQKPTVSKSTDTLFSTHLVTGHIGHTRHIGRLSTFFTNYTKQCKSLWTTFMEGIHNEFLTCTRFQARDSGPLLHLEKLAPENLIAPHDDATVSYPPSLRCFSSFGDRDIIKLGRVVKFYHREIRFV